MKLNGTKSSIYYAYSKDLKNVGAQFAFPTGDENAGGPGEGDKAAIVVLATRTNQAKQILLTGIDGQTFTNSSINGWNAGDILGELVFTSYVRFHARVTTSVIAVLQRE